MDDPRLDKKYLHQHLFYRYYLRITIIGFDKCIKDINSFDLTPDEKECFSKYFKQAKSLDKYFDKII
jgi:hypothetical protein